MKTWLKGLLIGLLTGIPIGFLIGLTLFGLEILPKTVWTWNFPWDNAIEMEGQMAAPMLIRLPDGGYLIAYKYEVWSGNFWNLLDYAEFTDGHWGARITAPTLGMFINNGYEIMMLPVYSVNESVYKCLYEKALHDIYHLQDAQDYYYRAWQHALQELIDAGLYEEEFIISFGDNSSGFQGVLRSYQKVK